MTKALIPIADGSEEMESVIVIDTLRRAGWEVISASISDQTITGSRGVRIISDALWDDIDPSSFDIIVLPGGADGTKALRSDKRVLDALKDFAASNRIIAAVCAGPLVLQEAGIITDRNITCHPGVRDQVKTATVLNDHIVKDGNIITSQGPGTTLEFSLELIKTIDGPDAVQTVVDGLIL